MNNIAIENIDKIIEMYRDKKSLAEIGEMYGLKPQGTGTFIHALRKVGAISDEDVKSRGRISRIDKQKEISDRNKNIISDYENFVDMEEMQEKYGISEITIKNILRDGGIKSNRRSYRNLDYPKNLIFDIFGGIDFEVSEDTERGLDFSLDTLREREKKVLNEYYREEKMLKEIAGIFCLSTERTRQIYAKALRKIRHPNRSNYIKFGYDGYTEMIKKKEEELKKDFANEKVKGVKIEELELSVRSYNCLKRSGVKVISDIKSKEWLMTIRNLGRMSYEEILSKIHNIGYEIPYEEID